MNALKSRFPCARQIWRTRYRCRLDRVLSQLSPDRKASRNVVDMSDRRPARNSAVAQACSPKLLLLLAIASSITAADFATIERRNARDSGVGDGARSRRLHRFGLGAVSATMSCPGYFGDDAGCASRSRIGRRGAQRSYARRMRRTACGSMSPIRDFDGDTRKAVMTGLCRLRRPGPRADRASWRSNCPVAWQRHGRLQPDFRHSGLSDRFVPTAACLCSPDGEQFAVAASAPTSRYLRVVSMTELSCGLPIRCSRERKLVEPSGIEPLTSCMPCRRSPS